MPARAILTRAILTRAVVVAVVLASVVLDATPAAAIADGTLVALGQYPFAARLTMTHIPRPLVSVGGVVVVDGGDPPTPGGRRRPA